MNIFILHVELDGVRVAVSQAGRWFDEAYSIWKKNVQESKGDRFIFAEAKMPDGNYLTVIPNLKHPHPLLCLKCGRAPEHSDPECEENLAEDRVRQVHGL